MAEPLLWTDVKIDVYEETTPNEYFPQDEDFIVVLKDVKTKAPDKKTSSPATPKKQPTV